MILSRSRIALTLAVVLLFVSSAMAYQEIREMRLVGKIMTEGVDACKSILKNSYYMREQALPFIQPKYNAKYRFAPNDRFTRNILSVTRNLRSSFKTLSGVLYHARVRDRDQFFKLADASCETLSNSAKRALRAIRDGNHSLYLASAETANREALNINRILSDLEDSINESIEQADLAHENL